MNLCFAANDLLGWAQRIGCIGQLRRATPKTIRHRLLHVAARITPNSRRLRLDHDWPWTADRHRRHPPSPHRIPSTHRDHEPLRSSSPMKDPG